MTRRVAILGGGIAGLSACYWWRRQPDTDVVLFEASDRVGGWIQTVERGGYQFEHGPRSCRAKGHGVATLELIRELGLQSELLPASPMAKRRYLYYEGQLQPLPSGLASLLRSPLTRGMVRALWKDLWMRPVTCDLSVDQLFRRHLGDHAADTMGDAMVTGIYAGDPSQLSTQCCFPQLYEWLAHRGSLVRGGLLAKKSPVPKWTQAYGPIFTLRGGMQRLVDALAREMASSIQLNQPVTSLSLEEERSVNGMQFDRIVCALPPAQLARLLPTAQVPVPPAASVAVVSLGLRERPQRYDGFGYLIPHQQREPILGCVWDGAVFPEQCAAGRSVLSVMMGGVRNSEILGQTDEALVQTAVESVSRHMRQSIEPEQVDVHRAVQAIPQYPVAYAQQRRRFTDALPEGVSVMGSGFDGVAVNDCVAGGMEAVKPFV